MREVGGEIGRLVAVGGGTKGSLWTQIVSDSVGLPQSIPEKTIGACYGDAFLASLAVGLVEPTTRWNPIATIVEPDPSVRAIYDELYGLYRQCYPTTLELTHRLAMIQDRQRMEHEQKKQRLL